MAENDYSHSLASGTVLFEYKITQVLGIGSFGITYLGEDINLGKRVAIKEYMPNDTAIRVESELVKPKSSRDEMDYAWGRERFLDEARVLAQFDHPNINRVYRYFEAHNTAYIVLEYIEGQTLADILDSQHVFVEDEVVSLLTQLADGLSIVHDAGYIHRDVKPANILLRPDHVPVLIDFGAARQAIGAKTKSITAIITPGYAPTEQYDQTTDLLGPWSDIYALGMVMYRCVTSRNDSEIADAVSRTLALNNKRPDPLASIRKSTGRFSKSLLDKIDWAINVNEKKRPQSIHEWMPSTSKSKSPTPEPTRKITKTKTKNFKAGKFILFAVVVVIAAGIIKIKFIDKTNDTISLDTKTVTSGKDQAKKIEFGKFTRSSGAQNLTKKTAKRKSITGLFDQRQFTINDRIIIHAQKGLSLRESATLDSTKLTSIYYGKTVEVLSNPLKDKPISVDGIRGHWMKVKYGLLTGYVFSGFLSGLPSVDASGFEGYSKKLDSVNAVSRLESDKYKYTGGCEWHQGHVIIDNINILDAYLVSRILFKLPSRLTIPTSASGNKSMTINEYRYEIQLKREHKHVVAITISQYSDNDLEALYSISQLKDNSYLIRQHPDKRGCG